MGWDWLQWKGGGIRVLTLQWNWRMWLLAILMRTGLLWKKNRNACLSTISTWRQLSTLRISKGVGHNFKGMDHFLEVFAYVCLNSYQSAAHPVIAASFLDCMPQVVRYSSMFHWLLCNVVSSQHLITKTAILTECGEPQTQRQTKKWNKWSIQHCLIMVRSVPICRSGTAVGGVVSDPL